jgi:hypothetical protein
MERRMKEFSQAATSADYSIGREIDGARLDLRRKKGSGGVGRLDGLGVMGELPGVVFYRCRRSDAGGGIHTGKDARRA